MGKDAGAIEMENQLYLVNTCFFLRNINMEKEITKALDQLLAYAPHFVSISYGGKALLATTVTTTTMRPSIRDRPRREPLAESVENDLNVVVMAASQNKCDHRRTLERICIFPLICTIAKDCDSSSAAVVQGPHRIG